MFQGRFSTDIRFALSRAVIKMVILLLLFTSRIFSISPSTRYKEDRRGYVLQQNNFFGGDMIIPQHLLRNGVADEAYRWPGYPGRAVVPYVIDENLSSAKDNILAAMETFHNNTCVRFVPRTDEKEYLHIFKGTEGCYATVGRDTLGEQPQPVSLASGCLEIGTVLHELAHSLGFFHEQNRSDRDDFIIIHEDNVKNGFLSNFRKLNPEQNFLLTPFDYDSIMIYGNYAFSKDGYSKTMEARNGQELLDPFRKTSLTNSDIQRIRLLYKCKNSYFPDSLN